jgi:polar amino acid transport system permease protein
MRFSTLNRPSVSYLLLLLLLSALFTFTFSQLHYQWNWAAIWTYREKFIQGWFTTLWLSAGALLLSLGLGTATALASRSSISLLRAAADLYVTLIRATPLLVQMLIFFYVVAEAFQVSNRTLIGLLVLGIFSGAYVAEIVRAALGTVPAGQQETALALGFTPSQTYRLIIGPQALRAALPPLAGQFISLIKDSSLLSVIGIQEFMLNAQEVNAFTYSTLEAYLPLAVGYLALTLPLGYASQYLERRLRYEA